MNTDLIKMVMEHSKEIISILQGATGVTCIVTGAIESIKIVEKTLDKEELSNKEKIKEILSGSGKVAIKLGSAFLVIFSAPYVFGGVQKLFTGNASAIISKAKIVKELPFFK